MPLQVSLKKGLIAQPRRPHLIRKLFAFNLLEGWPLFPEKKKEICELKLRKYHDLFQHWGKRRCLRVKRHQRGGRGVSALKLLCRPPSIIKLGEYIHIMYLQSITGAFCAYLARDIH